MTTCIRPAYPSAVRFSIAAALAACAVFASTASVAAVLVVDGFGAPGTPTVNSITGVGEASFNNSTASVLGGERGVYHHVYTNPLNNTATLKVGNGELDSVTGPSAQTEVLVSYGAFTRPTGDPSVGGPLLGLNVTPYGAFRFDFSSVSTTLNINVILYTANPLNPATPLYYSTVGVNVAPTVAGGPLTFDLPFALSDPFNFAQVDGILFEINRANDATGVSYKLDTFSLVSSVPEPTPIALWAAGLAAMLFLGRRRR
jgi:MYXO-CTERM domain-containing protein